MAPGSKRRAMSTEAETTLSISVRHLHAVERHAAQCYPSECCGFLLGDRGAAEAPERVRVHRVLPARNERDERAAERSYLIAPETVLAAQREASGLGLEVVGYYHSHPDRPAEPSTTDLEDAWPGMSYLIVSLDKGRPVEARSWRLRSEGEELVEEEVEAVGRPGRLAVSQPGAGGGA